MVQKMKSFKQFLEDAGTEQEIHVAIEGVDYYIEPEIFNRLKEASTLAAGFINDYNVPIFRGMRKGDVGVAKVRKDRQPKDTDPVIHAVFDDWFDDNFGFRARSSGLFATTRLSIAAGYDDVNMIFPLSEFKALVSDVFRDLYMSLDTHIDAYYKGELISIVHDLEKKYKKEFPKLLKYLHNENSSVMLSRVCTSFRFYDVSDDDIKKALAPLVVKVLNGYNDYQVIGTNDLSYKIGGELTVFADEYVFVNIDDILVANHSYDEGVVYIGTESFLVNNETEGPYPSKAQGKILLRVLKGL